MEKLNSPRRQILFSVVFLSLVGLIVVYSASCIYAFKMHHDAAFFLKRQAAFLIVSAALFFTVLFIDMGVVRKYNKEILLGTILLLCAVLILGKRAGGAKRWLTFFGIHFQPSELLKVSFLLYCCDYFVRKKENIRFFREGLLPLLSVAAVTFLLILLEPDLGTVVFWLLWMVLMFFIVRVRRKHLATLILCGVILSFFLVKTHPYRFRRLVSYFNPWADPQGSGFQLIQSQIALGEGGLLGVGLGEGKQKFLFLPAAHTDFVFSIIGEEFGLVGSFIIISLFFFLFVKMFTIARSIDDLFLHYVCVGISLIIALEVAINVGVSCGLLPTKGMTLPFISYGGTSLLIHYILVGIFFNCTKRYEDSLSVR